MFVFIINKPCLHKRFAHRPLQQNLTSPPHDTAIHHGSNLRHRRINQDLAATISSQMGPDSCDLVANKISIAQIRVVGYQPSFSASRSNLFLLFSLDGFYEKKHGTCIFCDCSVCSSRGSCRTDPFQIACTQQDKTCLGHI